MNQPANPAPGCTGALIYVVDDEMMICEMIAEVLTAAGHRVETFSDPSAAVTAFLRASPRPALVMTDYVMANLDGLKLIGIVKAAQPGLKTILFSGYVRWQFLHSRGEQPDQFLSKPFTAEQLSTTVASVLQAAS